MEDKKQKIVKVEGLGTVAFPSNMDDKEIVRVLDNHLSHKNNEFSGISTEQSEHKKQLVPAKPLSSSLPSLPKWMTTPIGDQAASIFEAIGRKVGFPDFNPFELQDKIMMGGIDKNHPVAAGIREGINSFAKGMTTPENLALISALPESKIMNGLFSVQALRGSYKTAKEAKKAFEEGRNKEAANLATQALLNAGVGAAAVAHGLHGTEAGAVLQQAGKELFSGTPESQAGFAEIPFGKNQDYIGAEESHRLFDKKAKESGINTSGSFLPSFESNYMKIDENLPHRLDARGNPIANEVRFSNHSPASFRPTFANWQGGTRAEFDKWANDTIQDIKDLRSGNVKAYQDRQNNKRFASLQKSADWWRENGNEQMAKNIERDIEKQKKSLGLTASPELTPTAAYKPVDQSQPFYLKSENIIADKMKGPMPAEDVHKMLLSNGVKPEEMKWTGLDEFLKGKGKQKVTPQELKDQIAGSNLQLHEIVKGTPPEKRLTPEETQEMYHLTAESERRHLTPEERMRLDDLDLREEASSMLGKETKFGSYTLPGAEPGSYREMLVTMPPSKSYEELDPEIRKLSNWPQDVKTAKNPADQAKLNQLNAEWERRYSQATQFKSSHWDEPNIIGHVRFNDRVGPNGEKILHLEELQSDAHQRGRKYGYKENVSKEQLDAAKTKVENTRRPAIEALNKVDDLGFDSPTEARVAIIQHPDWEKRWDVRDLDKKDVDAINAWRQAHIERANLEEKSNGANLVPDLPFKKTWPELLLKRMIKYASDHGYSGISWTPGEEQAARYDLSKQVERVMVGKSDKGYYFHAYPKGETANPVYKTGLTERELEDNIGKDLASKAIKDISEDETKHGKSGAHAVNYSGLDLKVGGSGMKGFYDKIIPDAANKLGKNWGAKVGKIDIDTGKPTSGEGWKQEPMWETIAKDGRLGKMPLYAIFDSGGNWVGTTGDPESGAVQPGEQVVQVADENGNLLKHAALPNKGKIVPYLPLNPQAKASIKSVPYSLFGVTGAALGLQSVKQKAEQLQNQFRQAGLAR